MASFPNKLDEPCTIESCYRPVKSEGYCNAHLLRVQRHGDPHADSPIGSKSYKGALISKAKTGKKRTGSPWNKGISHMAGEKHPNWKGGVGSERHRAMGQLEYKAWRSAVFARDNFTCQVCDQYGGSLHADHIKRWSEEPALRYSVDNGRTLCVPCHYYVSFKKQMPIGGRWTNVVRTK